MAAVSAAQNTFPALCCLGFNSVSEAGPILYVYPLVRIFTDLPMRNVGGYW